MSKIIFYVFFILINATGAFCSEQTKKEEQARIAKLPSGVTYDIRGLHLGENLLSYMHAKWLAYSNKVPLLFKPFPHSNQLSMHTAEKKLNESIEWEEMIEVTNENDVTYMDPAKHLYVVPFFSEYNPEYQTAPKAPYFAVNWDDKEFLSTLKPMFEPTSGFKALKLPKGRITVALHVRRGIPGESAEEIAANPLKFPPDQYYINQLKRLTDTFKGHPMYVFIFTDQKNPEPIAKVLEQALNNPKILFDWRKDGANYKVGAIDDFCNMLKFKCLVRPESQYSTAAEIIGDYSIVIKPVHSRYVKWRKVTIIDQVHVKVKKES